MTGLQVPVPPRRHPRAPTATRPIGTTRPTTSTRSRSGRCSPRERPEQDRRRGRRREGFEREERSTYEEEEEEEGGGRRRVGPRACRATAWIGRRRCASIGDGARPWQKARWSSRIIFRADARPPPPALTRPPPRCAGLRRRRRSVPPEEHQDCTIEAALRRI